MVNRTVSLDKIIEDIALEKEINKLNKKIEKINNKELKIIKEKGKIIDEKYKKENKRRDILKENAIIQINNLNNSYWKSENKVIFIKNKSKKQKDSGIRGCPHKIYNITLIINNNEETIIRKTQLTSYFSLQDIKIKFFIRKIDYDFHAEKIFEKQYLEFQEKAVENIMKILKSK